MAIVTNKSYGGLNWTMTNWSIGDSITETKLDNIEAGIAILMTEVDGVLREIGGVLDEATAGNIQLNSSRIDTLESRATSLESRATSIESINAAQSTKLSGVASEIWGSDTTSGTSRLDNVITEVWGSNTTSGTSRINSLNSDNTTNKSDISSLKTRVTAIETKNMEQDSKLNAIVSEIGGSISGDTYNGTTRIDSVVTEVYGLNDTSAISRIDDLEKEIGGVRSSGNGYTNSRIDSIETHDADIDKAIVAIKNEIGGTYIENSGFTTSRLDSLEAELGGVRDGENGYTDSRLDKLTIELYGSNITDYKMTSRIDKNDNKIAAIASELGGIAPDGTSTNYSGITRLDDLEAEIGGTRDTGNGYSNSRIDILESNNSTNINDINSLKNRTTALEERANTAESKASALATEIWGIDAVEGSSRLDQTDNKIAAIVAELGGTGSDGTSIIYSGTTRLDEIITEIYGSNNTSVDSRLNDLEKEVGGTRDIGNGYIGSRIDTLESTTSTNTTDLTAVKTQIWGTNTTLGNSRIDALKEKSDEHINQISAIVDELGGGTINNATYTGNSRLTTLENTVSAHTAQIASLDPQGISDLYSQLIDEIWGILVPEVWDGTPSDLINVDSRIDSLETNVTTIENDIDTLEANLNVELYETTNVTASDSLTTNIIPRNKSIFFLAIMQGTLGETNLKINDSIVNIKYNGDGVKARYAANSLVACYKNGTNYYIFNAPTII